MNRDDQVVLEKDRFRNQVYYADALKIWNAIDPFIEVQLINTTIIRTL